MSSENVISSSSSIPTVQKDQKGKTKSDNFTTEFQYYGAALRNLVPTLTNSIEQKRAISWVHTLFGPQYHVERLRDKRNRCLASFLINIINDELMGIFKKDPPAGPIKDLTKIKVVNAPNAEWENDNTWSEFVDCLDKEYKEISCIFHNSRGACKQDLSPNDKQFDDEFQFLLYEIRPYAAMIPHFESRSKVTAWVQTLCRINKENCLKMKELRNQYAYALYGYVHDLRVVGPFQDYPIFNTLLPLNEAAEQAAKRHPLTSPTCEEAESFLYKQPKPEEGAFCYIAVTGEFAQSDDLTSNFGG